MAAQMQLGRARPRTLVAVLVIVWVGVTGGLAWWLAASQDHARRDVAQRLAVRTSTGAEFASLYVHDISARERQQAISGLAGPHPTPESLARTSRNVGVSTSVLLDRSGRVLQAVPAKPGLVGQVITGKYPHLAAAVAGKDAVSDVVPSEAHGVPVVAFAVPFTTASGTRVFSGAYDLTKTPLGAYMSHMIVVPGRRVYLVDAKGTLVASSGPLKGGETLRQLDGRLSAGAEAHTTGSYGSPQGRQFFMTAAVSGTPWRVVAAVPEAQLYISLNGASKQLAWVAVASLAVAGLIIIMLGSRLLASRTRLAMLNRDLDRLARVDPLTGLRNRRDIEETLLGAMSAARRLQLSLAVLLIDIDHFKHINDTLGHQAGDAVLVNTGQTIRAVLRTEDTVGRWGGEEFLVVLPHTDAEGALLVAERVRAQIAVPAPEDTDPRNAVTVTIGAAVWASGGIEDLVSRADGALYAGKAAGRNNVQLAANASPIDVAGAHVSLNGIFGLQAATSAAVASKSAV